MPMSELGSFGEGGRPGGEGRIVVDDPMHLGQEPRQLRDTPRCGARTRAGKPCRSPSVVAERDAGCTAARRDQGVLREPATAITSMAATRPRRWPLVDG